MKGLTSKRSVVSTYIDLYNQFADDGFPELDPEMTQVVTELNQIPGLVTIGCCSGHPEEPGEDGNLYISCLADKHGTGAFFEILELIENIVRAIPTTHPYYRFRHRKIEVAVRHQVLLAMLPTRGKPAPVLTLRVSVANNREVEIAVTLFLEAIRTYQRRNV